MEKDKEIERMEEEEKEEYCSLLSDIELDEQKAVEDYKKLKGEEPLINAIIESIRTDELKHSGLLKAIYKDKCKKIYLTDEDRARQVQTKMDKPSIMFVDKK